ncbi:MAG TPA: hypothetical protein VFK02_09790 [Kofleriaceae bacterium]|nr:hypothetical protein [Kofleriaceae bacterium]
MDHRAYRVVVSLVIGVGLAGLLGAAGCGKEIGDACSFSSDCSPNGDRVCIDQTPAGGDGYCTVAGCDFSTCPGESVCVQFFTGNFANKPCDPDQDPPARPDPTIECTPDTNCCSFDEVCALAGYCVPTSSEIRFCMRSCSSDGDCRDGYECRDLDKMIEHGGQPVLEPGAKLDENVPRFCAKTPS